MNIEVKKMKNIKNQLWNKWYEQNYGPIHGPIGSCLWYPLTKVLFGELINDELDEELKND